MTGTGLLIGEQIGRLKIQIDGDGDICQFPHTPKEEQLRTISHTPQVIRQGCRAQAKDKCWVLGIKWSGVEHVLMFKTSRTYLVGAFDGWPS